MHFINSSDGLGCSISEVDMTLLWPGCDSEDAVRRALATVLLQDPDHRLRVAHVESLLQLQLPAHTGYTSGLGLQTVLLKDDATASVFHVDFANTRVLDWRSRVVYLDVLQLSKELAAARQTDHQQQQLPNVLNPNIDSITTTFDGNISVHSSDNYHPGDQQFTTANASSGQQQPSSLTSSSLGRQQPCTLEQIWGASPVFGACGGLSHGGLDETPASGRNAAGALSSSIEAGTAAPTATSSGAGEPRVSLFGGSFEVPHAIASCWAAASSCGSGAGSVDRRPSVARDAGSAGGFGAMNPAKAPGGAVLDHLDQGCGGSSTASGSSSRSISAAARAAAAAASRLRKVDNSAGFDAAYACKKAGPNEGVSLAGSASGMSGCLDVSTPKSYVVAGDASASASPVDSSSGEDDTEYNEAQLVFGSSGVPTSISAGAAAADMGNKASPAGKDIGKLIGAGPAAAAPAGDSDSMPLECGVDWSQIAALQHVQSQQVTTGSRSHLHSHTAPGGHQPLLFGVGDMFDDAPPSHPFHEAATAVTAPHVMQQQQSASYGAHMHTAGVVCSRTWLGDQAAGGLRPEPLMAAAAGGLPSPGVGAFVPGSAPAGTAVHEMLLQPDAAANTGVSYFGAAAAAAQLAESVLHDMDRGAGSVSSHIGMLQMHQGGNNASGKGFSKAVQSDISSNGRWAAVVGAGTAAQASPGVQSWQHMQQQRAPDSAGDIRSKSDQMKRGSAGAQSAAAAAGPGKEAGASTVAAARRDKTAASVGTACMSAAGPRLTGWASIAAKDPKLAAASPGANQSTAATTINTSNARESGSNGPGAHPRQQQVGGGMKGAGGALSRLPVAVRSEVQALVSQFPGVLKIDDFDEGVVHQLNAKRSEKEAVAAVRHIAHYDLGNIQHMAAYLNHLVKHYNHTAAAAAAAADGNGLGAALVGLGSEALRGQGLSSVSAAAAAAAGASGSTQHLITQSGSALGSTLGGPGNRGSSGGGSAAAGNFGAYGGQIRLASVPVSTKAMLQKLPLKVFKQLEQLVAGCAYLEWRHFDAGVVKVLAQLSKLCELDVFEELDLLAATDLSNVEYMPAYLNKRLNNKLWSRRKADGHINNISTG